MVLKNDEAANKPTYEIDIVMSTSVSPIRHYTVKVTKDKLHQIVGRYTLRYDSPLNMQSDKKGVTELEFYKVEGNVHHEITMKFWEIGEVIKEVPGVGMVSRARHKKTSPPLIEDVELVKQFIAAKVFELVS